ncbi:hypothetical protein BGZ74_009328, partial [Mortierella antarctica]
MTNKAEIAKQLMIIHNCITSTHKHTSSLAMVIHNNSKPICDPTMEDNPALLHHEDMRTQHLEDSVQLLDYSEQALRKDED